MAQEEYSEAVSFYGTARKMMDGVCVMHMRDAEGFLATNNFLLGFTVELFLKACLAGHGEANVRKYGHKLRQLFHAANAQALLEFEGKEGLRSMVEALADAHGGIVEGNYAYRYLRPGTSSTYVTSIGEALGVLNNFEIALRSRLGLPGATQ